jgi:hypothetical protein
VNGYQGSAYSSVQSERNDIFKPLVATTIKQVLNKSVIYSVVGRGGDLKGTSLPPVEVIFADVDTADEFRLKGAALSKAKTEGVSHLYFNACLTLSTRYHKSSFCSFFSDYFCIIILESASRSYERSQRRWPCQNELLFALLTLLGHIYQLVLLERVGVTISVSPRRSRPLANCSMKRI